MATREEWRALTDEFRAAFVELTKIEATLDEHAPPVRDGLVRAARERVRLARKNMNDFRAKNPHLVD